MVLMAGAEVVLSSMVFVQPPSPSPAPVNQGRTAGITKGAGSAPGAPLCKAILKLTCLLFVGSEVKLLSPPPHPPPLFLRPGSPHCGQAALAGLYLHGLEAFHAEEKSWFTVKG